MQSEVKKFIANLDGLTEEQRKFLTANKMTFAVTNVSVDKKAGTVSFDSVTDFHIVERVTLNKDEQKVWDLFNDFNSPKNAMAVILNCIESNTGVNAESYKNQGKITPSREMPKVKTFSQFWATLNEEEQKKAIGVADGWLKSNHIAETSFEFFFINGTNGVNLQSGDYVLGYDATYGQQLATRVLQASPNGFVTCLDNGGYFTLSGNSKPQVVSKESLPAEIVEVLDKTFDKINEETQEHKDYRLEKAVKSTEKEAEAQAKAEAKAQKEAKKLEEQAKKDAENVKLQAELEAMALNTPEAIKEAVEKLNQSKLAKETKETFRTKIKEAREQMKAQAVESKKAEKVETEPKAQPKAKETTKEAQALKDAKKEAKANYNKAQQNKGK